MLNFFQYNTADSDDAEAALPKPPIHILNVDRMDLRFERDMNEGTDYYYIDFKYFSGEVVSWKFLYEDVRLVSYNKALALSTCCGSDGGGEVTTTTTTTTTTASSIAFIPHVHVIEEIDDPAAYTHSSLIGKRFIYSREGFTQYPTQYTYNAVSGTITPTIPFTVGETIGFYFLGNI